MRNFGLENHAEHSPASGLHTHLQACHHPEEWQEASRFFQGFKSLADLGSRYEKVIGTVAGQHLLPRLRGEI